MNWRFWTSPPELRAGAGGEPDQPSTAERRESSLSDEIVNRILARAEGGVTLPTSTAVQEIAAGHLEPSIRGGKGRAGILPSGPSAYPRRYGDDRAVPTYPGGNSVWAVKVRGGEIRLDPIADYTITGEPDEATWKYVANRAGPSRQTTQKLGSARVIHIRIGTSPSNPWQGEGAAGDRGLFRFARGPHREPACRRGQRPGR